MRTSVFLRLIRLWWRMKELVDLKHKALLGRQERLFAEWTWTPLHYGALCPFTHFIPFDPHKEQELEQEGALYLPIPLTDLLQARVNYTQVSASPLLYLPQTAWIWFGPTTHLELLWPRLPMGCLGQNHWDTFLSLSCLDFTINILPLASRSHTFLWVFFFLLPLSLQLLLHCLSSLLQWPLACSFLVSLLDPILITSSSLVLPKPTDFF